MNRIIYFYKLAQEIKNYKDDFKKNVNASLSLITDDDNKKNKEKRKELKNYIVNEYEKAEKNEFDSYQTLLERDQGALDEILNKTGFDNSWSLIKEELDHLDEAELQEVLGYDLAEEYMMLKIDSLTRQDIIGVLENISRQGSPQLGLMPRYKKYYIDGIIRSLPKINF